MRSDPRTSVEHLEWGFEPGRRIRRIDSQRHRFFRFCPSFQKRKKKPWTTFSNHLTGVAHSTVAEDCVVMFKVWGKTKVPLAPASQATQGLLARLNVSAMALAIAMATAVATAGFLVVKE
jgi:hypothetical protein